MGEFSTLFLNFIASWGYVAIAVLMALENACVPIPSELILGFSGYLIFAGQMNFTEATTAGMIGGLLGSLLAYGVGHTGGRAFIDRYGKYLLIRKSHVDVAQRWFDRYGLKAVFFSRMLPVVRTFISLPAGFARMDLKKFVLFTLLGSLPWTMFVLFCGMLLGNGWERMLAVGHDLSLLFIAVCALIILGLYIRHKRRKRTERVDS